MNERNARILTFLLLLANCSVHAQSTYFFKTTESLELQLKDTETALSAEVLDGIGQELNSRISRAQAIEQLQQKLNKALETEDYFAADTIKKDLDRRISVRAKIDELRQGIESSLATEDYDKAEEFKGALIDEYKRLPKDNTNQPLKANSDSDQAAAAAAEEEKRKEIEAQQQRKAQELAEQKRKEAEAQKQREAQELAQKKKQEEEERIKREDEQRKAAELAAKKVEEEQKAAELEAKLAEERRRAAELEAKLAEEKRKADELEARLAEEDRIRQERITAEEADRKRRIEAEEAEERRLIAEEAERKLQEQTRRELARKLEEEARKERQARFENLPNYTELVSESLYSEHFDDSKVDFSVSTVEDRWKGPHNGAYESRLYVDDGAAFRFTTLNINIVEEKDYAISSNVLYIKGDIENPMGIVWGGEGNSFFMFGYNKKGTVTIAEYDNGILRNEFFAERKFPAIKDNWTNLLKVAKIGNEWVFVINGKEIHRIPYKGVYGVYSGFALPNNATARYDNFNVSYISVGSLKSDLTKPAE